MDQPVGRNESPTSVCKTLFALRNLRGLVTHSVSHKPPKFTAEDFFGRGTSTEPVNDQYTRIHSAHGQHY